MSATALILAAGEGTRMKSALPKVAHRILGVPLIAHVIESARSAGVERIVVVTGHGAERVEPLAQGPGVSFARQLQLLGTGDAVRSALQSTGPLDGPVVVLAGDAPLLRPETIAALLEAQAAVGAACVVLSAVFADPTGYGRIIRDEAGAVRAIIEHRDLAPDMLGITEGNAGVYCFDGRLLGEYLPRLQAANAQGEFYLTDLVGLFVEDGLRVEALKVGDAQEALGVNSRVQLAEAGRVMQRRINERHMLAGVTMTDPGLVWIGPHVSIGRDVVIEPMTFLMGDTTVGEGCTLGPDTRIDNSTIGADCVVDSSIVTDSRLEDDVLVGPRAYLCRGTVMAEGSRRGYDNL